MITDLQLIENFAHKKEDENEEFRRFLKNVNSINVDKTVEDLNNTIAPQIDCTQCSRCCQSLIIHVTQSEADDLARHLNTTAGNIEKQYLEISEQGQMVMNMIPCKFLLDKKCTIYENRFSECRDFPHLHKPGFTKRLFATFMYYGMCPIIYNVVEELKVKTGFLP